MKSKLHPTSSCTSVCLEVAVIASQKLKCDANALISAIVANLQGILCTGRDESLESGPYREGSSLQSPAVASAPHGSFASSALRTSASALLSANGFAGRPTDSSTPASPRPAHAGAGCSGARQPRGYNLGSGLGSVPWPDSLGGPPCACEGRGLEGHSLAAAGSWTAPGNSAGVPGFPGPAAGSRPASGKLAGVPGFSRPAAGSRTAPGSRAGVPGLLGPAGMGSADDAGGEVGPAMAQLGCRVRVTAASEGSGDSAGALPGRARHPVPNPAPHSKPALCPCGRTASAAASHGDGMACGPTPNPDSPHSVMARDALQSSPLCGRDGDCAMPDAQCAGTRAEDTGGLARPGSPSLPPAVCTSSLVQRSCAAGCYIAWGS